jgi:uncharacterized Zn finger protein (UPF0148 family)
MDTPRRINYEHLKGWLDEKPGNGQPKNASTGIVRESDLIKVGGLYRIREDYEAVWRMEAGEDGKRYIVRADEGGTDAPQRLLVTSETAAEDSAKAAYKIVRAGAVYVAWECEACATPNLTKFGNTYECDECHKHYADVLRTEEQMRQDKRTYTREEVAEYEPAFAERMAKAGIRVAHVSLLQVWEREAASTTRCSECGDLVESSAMDKHKVHCPKKLSAAKAVNPWAVCHKSVGPEKSEKFERCVQDVKKKSPVKE